MPQERRLEMVRMLTRAAMEALAPKRLDRFNDEFAAFALTGGRPRVEERTGYLTGRDQGLDTMLVAGMFFQVLVEAEQLPAGDPERVSFLKRRAKDDLVDRLSGQITLSRFFRLLSLIEDNVTRYFQGLKGDWAGQPPTPAPLPTPFFRLQPASRASGALETGHCPAARFHGQGHRERRRDKAPRLYNLDQEVGEPTNLAEKHPDVVVRLQALAARMDAEIGGNNPASRRLAGEVAKPKPLYPIKETNAAQGGANTNLASTKPVRLDSLKPGDRLGGVSAPQVANRAFILECVVETVQADAIILAHGGVSTGYALHAKGRRIAFAVRTGRESLKNLEADETLLVQSGKPVVVFKSHKDGSPKVLTANSNIVPHWATQEHFDQLAAAGLIMYGQMTAGSWIYIGTQGILQGTYETFGALAKLKGWGSLKGKFVLTAGLGGMGGAQPLSITMNEGVGLIVEVDPERAERRRAIGYVDMVVDNLEEAMTLVEENVKNKTPRSIGLIGNAADVYTPGTALRRRARIPGRMAVGLSASI